MTELLTIKFAKKTTLAFFRRLLYVPSTLIALVLIFISPVIKIRLMGLQSFRIGHYALTTELMLCALDTNAAYRNKKTIYFNMAKPANTQLYKMWKRVIPIFPWSRLAIQVDQVLSWILGKSYLKDEFKNIYESCGSGTVDRQGLLKKIKNPNLSFTKKEINEAKKLMVKIGIPDNSKFICLIVRDSGYLNHQYPETDWRYHDHRNASIQSYKKSTLYLAEQGYYVLRMGKFVNEKFNLSHPKVIDYANHTLRSDFMDIYLQANCTFCISTCTGLDCVSQVFRKPVLLTNISPTFGETLMWFPCTVFIPKELKNKSTNEFLSLSETAKICHSLPSNNVLAEFANLTLELVDNDEDQLLEAVKEMEARVTEKWQETSEQQVLQEQYWTHHKKHRPILVDDVYIKIGATFLSNTNRLLN